MRQRSLHTRAVALTVAYAIALQALLIAAMPLAPAGDAASALCTSEPAPAGGQQPDRPHGHDWPCGPGCLMVGCGMAGDHPRSSGLALPAPRAEPAAATMFTSLLPPPIALGPQAPRAPPLG